MLSILIVCTGNTCRSPMAETLMNRLIRQNRLTDKIKVLSAGIYADVDCPASQGAQAAMASRGLSLTDHRSRQILPEYIQAADIILTMTRGHKQALVNMVPKAADKIFTLNEYADKEGDVQDPYGGTPEVYDKSAAEIEQLLAAIWQKIAY